LRFNSLFNFAEENSLTSHKKAALSIVVLVVFSLCLTVVMFAALGESQILPHLGSVKTTNVSIYSDYECTKNCTALCDLVVYPGCNFTKTVFVKNNGNTPELLTMTVDQWNPCYASSYLNITWNQENTVLEPGEIIQAALTLEAASNANSLKSFGYVLTLTGTPYKSE